MSVRGALSSVARGGRRLDSGVGISRASVAAVFRLRSGEEQILLIRRAINPNDKWSGEIALPGGRQGEEDGGEDEQTAMREAWEEVGLELRHCQRLGRLADDRLLSHRGGAMVLSVFGFVLRSGEDASPNACGAEVGGSTQQRWERGKSLERQGKEGREGRGGEKREDIFCSQGGKLIPQQGEVADAWWVDTRVLRPERVGWRYQSLERLLKRSLALSPLLRLVGCKRVVYAAIDLPRPLKGAASAGARLLCT